LNEARDHIEGFLARSLAALESVTKDSDFPRILAEIADAVVGSLSNGGKLLIAGNGGSAADAQHVAAEFLSRFVSERRPLPAIALTTDTSALTAIGNDYGFDRVFERQLRALGRPGDVFLAISTSGRSPNIIAALQAAREIGITTVGFTGRSGQPMSGLCDLGLMAPSSETAIIQQIHIVAGHVLCGLVEKSVLAGPFRR
jgi:D-sedoheptulose 7-phosphate isomerase